jgi:hypothetical protein
MDNIRGKMERVANTRKVEAEVAQKQYNESSSKSLFKILEKKLQTSFIGALSQFEQQFGALWGHRKDESELTPVELEWRHKWEEARTNILNNGNNQVRAIQSELAQYTITWNRYQLNMRVQ